MAFNDKYPHPAVTTDIVIFTVLGNVLKILLIRRRNEPFKGKWALPGGFLEMEEDLETCARRELEEETGLRNTYLEQLYTYGAVNRDPRERVISVAYYALIRPHGHHIKAGDDAAQAEWFDVDGLPMLAFDHAEIIEKALIRLAAKMDYSTIGLQLMGKEFTLGGLMRVYELAGRKRLDKRNFRKWILSHDLIEETGQKLAEGPYRPAMLYRVKDKSRIDFFR
ncbi:MAG: NUDIX hydrolase [Alphaproteobacteria bacterium]|nr:MAG: NUDIX hydrolase [Alphaproteobacteria bacterium]